MTPAASMRDRIDRLKGRQPPRAVPPFEEFHSDKYVRLNQRRQEHLASLGLPLAGKSVLEVGAGIGDHTSFFLDRGCTVIATEGRPENLAVLRARYAELDVRLLDLDRPDRSFDDQVDVVYCYGVLYHLRKPARALEFLGRRSRELLLLESCVSQGTKESVNRVREPEWNPSQSLSGTGCRPTRSWIHAQLKRQFEFVYMTTTQPWHPEFPTDWTVPAAPGENIRAIWVASREPLANPLLTDEIPDRQSRQ
jgi:SAM-dependent methyltransferase